MNSIRNLVSATLLIFIVSCQQNKNNLNQEDSAAVDTAVTCSSNLPSRYGTMPDDTKINGHIADHQGMVHIPAGEFLMGSSDGEGRADEYPQHKIKLAAFWMDASEVTNARFAEFVKATGYITTAERKPDWEELKKQVPEGTPKPPDSVLVPASLVFSPPLKINDLDNVSQWWTWQKGANWRHPQGPSSTIKYKADYPVVHVSYEDAMAYCKWSGKRLPTEAEWEYAGRGGLANAIYPWGNENPEIGTTKANTWQGKFPIKNTMRDGFDRLAPTKRFNPNGYGLYDMAGNVWEWCSDWYRPDYYKSNTASSVVAPQGPSDSYDPMEPQSQKKVVRGGSFMCHDSYCKGYRVSSRMKSSTDTGLENTGFRCVVSE
ncbi:MAG: formylglycine-generating enzyme family protein [Bacteroidota bacterium]